MNSIETKRRVGRPKRLKRPLSRTIYVEGDEYEEISKEAEKQGMSFFEFVSMLYRVYARDPNKEILNALKELKETKAEISRLTKENQDLSEKLKKQSLKAIDADLIISEARDKMDEWRPRFETDIRLSQSGELSANKEVLKRRRELFRERKTEYMQIKRKIEKAEIHDIDPEISDFDALVSNAQKALGISQRGGKE